MTIAAQIAPALTVEPTLAAARQLPAQAAPAPQAALVQELPLDLLDHVGGGSGLTLIV